MTSNGKCDITAIQGRKKCKYKANKVGKSAETNARIDHKKCGILSEKGRCDNVSICNE